MEYISYKSKKMKSLDGLKRGIYVINDRKVIIK